MANANPELSESELKFFETFGYLTLRGLLAKEIEEVSRGFEEVLKRHWDEVFEITADLHEGLPRKIFPNIVDKDPRFAALTTDRRLTVVVTQLLGIGSKFIGSDANVFNCGSNWHNDATIIAFGGRAAKVVFYLDVMRGADGFRLIPGSHLEGSPLRGLLSEHMLDKQTPFGLSPQEIPCHLVDIEPGDAIVFDVRLWHAVKHAGRARRMMSFIYADKTFVPRPVGPDERVAALRGLLRGATAQERESEVADHRLKQ